MGIISELHRGHHRSKRQKMNSFHSVIESFANLACPAEQAHPNSPVPDAGCVNPSFDFGCKNTDGGTRSKSPVHFSNNDTKSPKSVVTSFDESQINEYRQKLQDRRISNKKRRTEVFRSRGFEDPDTPSHSPPYLVSCLLRNDAFAGGLCFLPRQKKKVSAMLHNTSTAILMELTDDFDENHDPDGSNRDSIPYLINSGSLSSEFSLYDNDRVGDFGAMNGVIKKFKKIKKEKSRSRLELDKNMTVHQVEDKQKIRHHSLFDVCDDPLGNVPPPPLPLPPDIPGDGPIGNISEALSTSTPTRISNPSEDALKETSSSPSPQVPDLVELTSTESSNTKSSYTTKKSCSN